MDDLLDQEFIDHLEQEYDGFTDFVECKLREERNEMPDLEKKIEEKEEKLDQLYEELQGLKEKKERQENRELLEEKRQRLRDLQKEFKRLQRDGLVSRDEAEEKVLSKARSRVMYQDLSDEEIVSELGEENFENQVERHLVDKEQLSDLRKEISSLQDEIESLNGGREDFFIDLDDHEEVQAI